MPEGSGCDPGPGDLPDGLWFGTVEGLTADELELDLACWFIGEDAVMAAEEDGAESPPPNDYYVRNDSTEVRTVPIDPAATALIHPTGSPDDQVSGTIADLIAAAEARDGYPWGCGSRSRAAWSWTCRSSGCPEEPEEELIVGSWRHAVEVHAPR